MRPRPRPSPRLAVLPIGLAVFLVQLDIAAVVAAMPAIAAELALDAAGLAWVMDAYSLAFVAALTAAGVLADRHGRRRALAAGVALFAAASLGCGLAPGAATLLVARAGQGLGAAAVICGGLALLSGLARDGTERARLFGTVGVVSGTAMALGPAAGGLIAAAAGWRWIFLVNLPLCAGIALALPRAAAESRDPTLRPLDGAGIALLAAALVLLVASLLHGAAGGWGLPAAGGLGLGVILLAAFAAHAGRHPHPAVDIALLRDPACAGICLVALLMSVSYWSVLVYLPPLVSGLGLSPAETGCALLAATLPMLALPPAGARAQARLAPRHFFALGFALNVAGDLLLALAAARASLALALAGMALTGGGTGLVNAQISSVAAALAPPARAGMAAGVVTVMRQGGFAVGIALLGLAAHAPTLLFAAAAAVGAIGAIAALALLRR